MMVNTIILKIWIYMCNIKICASWATNQCLQCNMRWYINIIQIPEVRKQQLHHNETVIICEQHNNQYIIIMGMILSSMLCNFHIQYCIIKFIEQRHWNIAGEYYYDAHGINKIHKHYYCNACGINKIHPHYHNNNNELVM